MEKRRKAFDYIDYTHWSFNHSITLNLSHGMILNFNTLIEVKTDRLPRFECSEIVTN